MSSLQTEKEILGAILLSEANYWEAAEFLTPDSFASKDHQGIFKVMGELASANRAIRATAVSSRLGIVEGEEPQVYLSALLKLAQDATEKEGLRVAENAEDLARAAVARKIEDMCLRTAKQAVKPGADPFELIESLQTQIADLVHAADQTIERSVGQVGQEVLKLLQDASKLGGIGLTTGLVTLDAMIGKIFPGDFVLLGGSPGAGKTSLATQIALHIARRDPVGFLELEMEGRMLLLRTIAGVTGVSVRTMLDGVRERQFETVSDAVQKLSDRHLHMVAQRGMSIGQVEARIRSMQRRHGIKAVFVDHLGLIKRPQKYRVSKHEKDFDNAEDLMELGKALGIPIIALCHLTKASRQDKDRDNPEPTMEDFSGGGMEQHADLMLCTFNRYEWLDKNKPKTKGEAFKQWLSDRQNNENRMEIFKLKDRKGPGRESKKFHWDGARTLFSDLEGAQPDLIQQETMEGF